MVFIGFKIILRNHEIHTTSYSILLCIFFFAHLLGMEEAEVDAESNTKAVFLQMGLPLNHPKLLMINGTANAVGYPFF